MAVIALGAPKVARSRLNFAPRVADIDSRGVGMHHIQAHHCVALHA